MFIELGALNVMKTKELYSKNSIECHGYSCFKTTFAAITDVSRLDLVLTRAGSPICKASELTLALT